MAYSTDTAQVQMTLSAIAYTTGSDDGNPSAQDITNELNNTSYVTNGKWQLVWGPAISEEHDNLMLLAQQTGTTTFSIVIRGTEFTSLESWAGDLPTGQSDFSTYTPGTTTSVSNKFMEMLQAMVDVTCAGDTLASFLSGLATGNSDLTIYVTGHSQGAGLAPLFLAWLLQQAAGWSNTTTGCVSYGFAPPTAGGADFQGWVADNATSYLVVNPNDIVPFGYDNIEGIVTQNVPTTVPKYIIVDSIKINVPDLILATALAADLAATISPWAQAGQIQELTGENDPNSSDSWLTQVGLQHNHNSYLVLLGAPQTDIPPPSTLPKP